jgi:hypothetical protein
VAVEDKTALSAARALLQTVGIFGVPLTIRSDGGGEFINDVIKSLEHVLGTSHHKVSPYLHTGNSLAEKANRSILEHLRNLIFDKRLSCMVSTNGPTSSRSRNGSSTPVLTAALAAPHYHCFSARTSTSTAACCVPSRNLPAATPTTMSLC